MRFRWGCAGVTLRSGAPWHNGASSKMCECLVYAWAAQVWQGTYKMCDTGAKVQPLG